MADPNLAPFKTARNGASDMENNDPVTDKPYVTGSPRLMVDLSQAVLVFDREQ